MTNEELWIKHRHDHNRKSCTWEEVYDYGAMIEEADARQMPIYRAEEIGMESPMDDCLDGKTDTICIVVRDGQGYLVNTEGFKYARYIVPVKIVKSLEYVDILDLLK
jgi:hypothetical protein